MKRTLRIALVICLGLTALLFASCAGDNASTSGTPGNEDPNNGTPGGDGADPTTLPLLSISALEYQGAFRVPADTYGVSSMNYSQGPIAYHPARHSLFMVGHTYEQAIAEFGIPALVKSDSVAQLPIAGAPLQGFASILERTPNGNPQALDRIGGLAVIDGQLVVNAFEYYDAPGDNSQTTLVLKDISNLGTCAVDGFFTFQGGAGHTSGWISPVPAVWQTALGQTHITGQSSGQPIISRLSVGPSAFLFDPQALLGDSPDPTAPIPTTMLLDFSLDQPLHSDLANDSGSNDLWTHLSRAVYGFIVPGTRTYLTVGSSGGHDSGVCYKCEQSDGETCGGYCAPNVDDYYNYYWLWDVQEMVQVKNGERAASALRPYAYGIFPTPIAGAEKNALGGGAFDPQSGLLYLTLQGADREQGQYANPPVVIVYSFDGLE